jgi:polar amino acid transport system permease protein
VPDWLTPDVREQLLDGVVITVWLTVLTSVGSLLLGVLAALGRSSATRWKRRLAGSFVETFRNIPALILIIFFAFAVPNVVSADRRKGIFFDNDVVDALSSVTGSPLPYYAVAAGMALTLNTSAHMAEIIRSGFGSVPASRVDAARSLGASHRAALRTVVVPHGVRVAFPAISNRLIHNMKNTSLASFVAVPELFQVIQGSITKTFRATEFLVLAALLYLLLSTVMTVGLKGVGRWLWRKQPELGSQHG